MLDFLFDPYNSLSMVLRGVVFGVVGYQVAKWIYGRLGPYIIGHKVSVAIKDFDLWVKRADPRYVSAGASEIVQSMLLQLAFYADEQKKFARSHAIKHCALLVKLPVLLRYAEEEDLDEALSVIKNYFYMTYGTFVDANKSKHRNHIDFNILSKEMSKETFYPMMTIGDDGEIKLANPESEIKMILSKIACIEVIVSVKTVSTRADYDYKQHFS